MEEIEPSEFDLVVLGTGLTESIVAAAAAKAGRSVLQMDPSPQYGGSWASLRLSELTALLQSQQLGGKASVSDAQQRQLATVSITEAEVWQQPGADLGPDHQFSIDLAPKVAYGAGPLIQLLLGSGAHNYLEFKLVQGSYLLELGGSDSNDSQLRTIPSSRSEVFKDRQLSLPQKRSVMRFLKAAAEAVQGWGPLKDAFGQQPIQELLVQQGLDVQLQQSVLHGVLMADRVPGKACTDPGQQAHLTAAQALERMRVYVQSTGRYGPDTGPFLTPLYGCGELPQAFCRVAAVAGAVQVLRCSIDSLTFDEHTFSCSGMELSSGQAIRCRYLAACDAVLDEWLVTFQPAVAVHATHRCCAVLDVPLVPGERQTMVTLLPPLAASGEAAAAGSSSARVVVRALALSSSTSVCPPGKHLLYLWTEADSSRRDKTDSSRLQTAAQVLLPALQALADISKLQGPASSSSNSNHPGVASAVEMEGLPSGSAADTVSKAAVLWAGFYSQTSRQIIVDSSSSSSAGGGRWPANVALCPGPDSTTTFASAVEAAKQCYWLLLSPERGVGAGFPLDPQVPQEHVEQQPGEQSAEEAAAASRGALAADVNSDDEVVAALQAVLQPAICPSQELHRGGGQQE